MRRGPQLGHLCSDDDDMNNDDNGDYDDDDNDYDDDDDNDYNDDDDDDDMHDCMRRRPQLGHLCSDGCRGKYAAVSDKVSSVRLEASSLCQLCLVVCSSEHKWNWPYWKSQTPIC